MADFVFTSPGVKFKERDLTYVTRNVGITTLGVAGETLKGPAFEPVFIQDQTQFSNRFGNQSVTRFPDGNLQYQLPYVANSFLEEAQQLWVTRVLGLSGYKAGTAWNITMSAGVDSSTTGLSSTVTFGSTAFTDSAFLGVAISNIGQTGTTSTGWEKTGTTSFGNVVTYFEVLTYSSTTGLGTVSGTTSVMTGTSLSDYEGMVLAVIRSRGDSTTPIDSIPVTEFDTTNLVITSNTTIDSIISPTGDLFGEFNLVASSGTTTATYNVSLNPNDASFLPNVIGSKAKDKSTMIWTEAIYPDLIKKLDNDGIGYGINTVMVTGTTDYFSDYEISFQTPETPWVVSQLKGNVINRLFKFISISDGDSANQEIKITIGNIDPHLKQFDVIIRSFYDTDILETYSNCSLIKGQSSYIGQRIGTSDGEYTLKSKYVMVEMEDNLSVDVFPAGFEGYLQHSYTTAVTGDAVSEGISPKIFYKTSYADTDNINKTYLGVSETAYTNDGINQNFFNFVNYYSGQQSTGFTKSKGYHMDSGATGTSYMNGEFEVGAGKFRTYNDTDDITNPYYSIKTRKFTFAPAGGFDDWDVNRRERSYTDGYVQGGRQSGHPSQPLVVPTNDYQAWELAINTFSNPENVTINLLATPGINWVDQTSLVQATIDMVETQRTDTLYVIDAPELAGYIVPTVGGSGKEDIVVATEIAQLLDDTAIDSSYSATYFPWIQMNDSYNNVKVYIPPTGEVVRAMAFTDNVKFPWFAPAGLTRGVTNAIKPMYRLSQEARDTIYKGRINPLVQFADVGTAIFGQKTLQVKETALDRINVRRLLLQIKILISNISIRLLFDQNDQEIIDQFLTKVNPILDSIKRERGLTDFRIKMDASNNTTETLDRNELYGEIFLKPTRSLEFIGITFTITPTGASFDDL